MTRVVPPPTALPEGRFQGFEDLMRSRVQDVLLVSSLYESFILAEDGQVSELVLSEYLDLNLRHTPGLTRVPSGEEALRAVREQPRFNLIISSLQLGDMNALELARRVKAENLHVPVCVLAYDMRELEEFRSRFDLSDLERVFIWQGDVRILIAIVKYIEDKMNVEHDTGAAGVQSIIVVEDSVRYYSSFLPMIYTELVKHSQDLISEGVNVSHKILRMRARPKILLCSTFEEAWAYFEKYQSDILGVISDISFPRGGEKREDSGVELARRIRSARPDVPIILQSSNTTYAQLARELGASFLWKNSPVLLNDLSKYMNDLFSFGEFVFRMPDGSAVGTARNLRELEERLETVPGESIAYHGERNHFSSWLKARAEFSLAHALRPRRVSDYDDHEALRADLIRSIREYRRMLTRGTVADFKAETYDEEVVITRIGGGSLGGKARGLAFMNQLLHRFRLTDRYEGTRVSVPPSVVIGTDVFDEFLELNGLRDFALNSHDHAEVRQRLLDGTFPPAAASDLRAFLERVTHPLAVRSSSLLEDSQFQPLAGIYDTFMIPNHQPDLDERLEHVVDAVKHVYASTFAAQTKTFFKTTPYRLEEEKMAVIVQRVAGARHGDRLYPEISGVARSYNFYPSPPMKSEEGVVAAALGLGKTVVEGGNCIRFSPMHPGHLMHFASPQEIVDNSQRHFYALQIADDGAETARTMELRQFGLGVAETDGTLAALASTFSPENDAVYDGTSRKGVRVVTMAPVLKHGLFPLADIVAGLLDLGKNGTGAEVEIEFAVNLSVPPGSPKEFALLQMRPLSLGGAEEELEIGDVRDEELLCRSDMVLGNGRLEGIRDVVAVDYHHFDRLKTREAMREVSDFNADLAAEGRPYLLIGVGRWGSNDPHLGIPVRWEDIHAARAIVEASFRDLVVTPSQGSHFFQNIQSSHVGYFTVNPGPGHAFVDWEWLDSLTPLKKAAFFRHFRFDRPLTVKMNGRANEGVIYKPA